MKLDTLGVQAFISIADHTSFQRAADELHISQTAITRRLQNLETHLGVKLIERTTRTLALTATGRDFLPQARRLTSELSNALMEIFESGKARRGDVCIACVPTAGIQFLPKIIQEYSDLFPDNRITVLDHSSAAVADAVLRREAELGINVAQTHHPDLTSTRLLTDEFALVCRDDHPLAKKKSVDWKALAAYPLIFAGQANANRSVLDQALGSSKVKLQLFYEVQRSSTALGLVAEGVAAAVVPRLAMQKGAYPRLRAVALVDPIITRSLVLVRRTAAHLSPAAQALYELIKRRAEAETPSSVSASRRIGKLLA
jgi:DNA-binding transcriptional LysR family regulator